MKLRQMMFMRIFKEKKVVPLVSVNKKVIGKMKDEVREDIINEFFGLKAKMYSLVMLEDKEIKKTKRCQKCC